MELKETPRTNFTPIDLKYRQSMSYGFSGSDNPANNNSLIAQYQGLLAEKNSVNLLNTSDIISNDASNIVGGRQFDAVVDLYGKGDFLTIQDALNAGKKRIFIRNGIHIIKSSINIVSDNVLLVGEDRSNTVLTFPDSPTSDYVMLQIGDDSTTYSGITIKNIKFNGNRTNQSTAGVLLQTDKISNLQILDCDMVDSYTNSLIMQETYRALVSGCYIDNIRYYGIIVRDSSSNCSVINNYINNSNLVNAESITIESDDNLISGNTLIGGNCIVVKNSNYNIVVNNNLKESLTYGIYVYGTSSSADYNVISSNIITSSQYDGIRIMGGAYNRITNNLVKDSSQQANNIHNGIHLIAYSTNYSAYNIVSNNHVVETATNKSKYGIYEYTSNDDYNIIANNIVQGAVTANISAGAGGNTIIANNIA